MNKRPAICAVMISILLFADVYNGICSLLQILKPGANAGPFPSWHFPLLLARSLLNISLLFAVLKRRKWGFYGYILTAVVAAYANNAIYNDPTKAISTAFFGVLLLFSVLNIGGEKRAWSAMK